MSHSPLLDIIINHLINSIMAWVNALHQFSSTPIKLFTASWVVPPPPTKNVDQVIYIFNGLQASLYDTMPGYNRHFHSSGASILQPVLSWGAHTGKGWEVSNYCLTTTPIAGEGDWDPHDVQTGDLITGTISVAKDASGETVYKLQTDVGDVKGKIYASYKGTITESKIIKTWESLVGNGIKYVPGTLVFNEAVIVIEAYASNHRPPAYLYCDDYPNTPSITFYSMVLEDSEGGINQDWQKDFLVLKQSGCTNVNGGNVDTTLGSDGEVKLGVQAKL